MELLGANGEKSRKVMSGINGDLRMINEKLVKFTYLEVCHINLDGTFLRAFHISISNLTYFEFAKFV